MDCDKKHDKVEHKLEGIRKTVTDTQIDVAAFRGEVLGKLDSLVDKIKGLPKTHDVTEAIKEHRLECAAMPANNRAKQIGIPVGAAGLGAAILYIVDLLSGKL